MAWTFHVDNPQKGKTNSWELTGTVLTVGRNPKSDISLQNPTVSWDHARIDGDTQTIRITDLKSSNGTRVNSRLVHAEILRHGDTIQIGSISLLCQQTEDYVQDDAEPLSLDKTSLLQSTYLDGSPLVVDDLDKPEVERFRLLFAVIENLANRLHLSEMLPEVLTVLEKLFNCDRCAIAEVQRDGLPVLLAGKPDGTSTPVSNSIVQQVVRTGEALLCDDIQGNSDLTMSESVYGLNIRSVLCAPLVFRSSIHGLLYLERSAASAWHQHDLDLLISVSHVISIVLENAMLYAKLEQRFDQQAEMLRRTEKRLIRAERTATLGRLAQVIAHEIRNPLMIIGGLLKRVLINGLPDKAAKKLTLVTNEVVRLESMMQQVDNIVHLPPPVIIGQSLEKTIQITFQKVSHLISEKKVHLNLSSSLEQRIVFHDPELTSIACEAVIINRIAEKRPMDTLFFVLSEHNDTVVIDIMDNKLDDVVLLPLFDPHFHAKPWAVDLRLTLAQQALASQDGTLLLPVERTHHCFFVRFQLSDTPLFS